MPAGRPPKYKTPEEAQKVIDDYFETDAYMGEGDNRMFAPTMSGLALALGICRQTLANYSEKDEFLDTIKDARERVAVALEQRLYMPSPTGVIFNLKNNFGWKDKQEVEQTGNFKVTIGMDDAGTL